MQAGDDALIGESGQQAGPGLQFGQRSGDQACQHRRAALPAVERRGLPGLVARSLGERRAAAAVDVDVDEPREDPLPAQVNGGLTGGRTGPDRVDHGAGEADPAGIENAVRSDDATALQQEHHVRMTERDSARGWSGSMPWRSARSTASRCAPVRPTSGSASEARTIAPVRRASASRLDGTGPSVQTTVVSSLTLIGPCRYSSAG